MSGGYTGIPVPRPAYPHSPVFPHSWSMCPGRLVLRRASRAEQNVSDGDRRRVFSGHALFSSNHRPLLLSLRSGGGSLHLGRYLILFNTLAAIMIVGHLSYDSLSKASPGGQAGQSGYTLQF